VAVVQIASEITVSHPAPDSDRVATLSVGVGLTEAPLDRPVLAEVPVSALVDSATARAAADAVAGDAAGEVAEDKGTIYEGN
jgi:hypothetical protein